jgi:hypothetical protein
MLGESVEKLLFVYKPEPLAGHQEDDYLTLFMDAMDTMGVSRERVLVARNPVEARALWAEHKDRIGLALVHTDENILDLLAFLHRQQKGIPVALICPYGEYLKSLSDNERKDLLGGKVIVSDEAEIQQVIFPLIKDTLLLPGVPPPSPDLSGQKLG